MAPIIRPSRKASFTGHAKGPFPGDLLDAQIQNLIDAIHSTQVALADVRRDDGGLKTQPQPLSREVKEIEQNITQTGAAVAAAAAQFASTYRDVDLRVKDAEVAAFSVQGVSGRAAEAIVAVTDAISDAENSADRAETAAIASQNSANYSQAQTDNAIAANVEATQWAEYLAGPVVNSANAPAYIQGHPFGHGLYYQPVEGGVAGLWSAKWWALYAQQLVGSWSFYYLGSWASPPVPGSTNPNTGVQVPSPLAPGSFYYNITSHQLFVWDGTQWNQPFVQVLSPGLQSSFVYVASAGQTIFTGTDINGHIPTVGTSPSDVHKNGLRLVYGSQYSVNSTTNRLTLVTPAAASDVIQWDLLSGSDLSVGVTIQKVTINPLPDGARTQFTMTYIDPSTGETAVSVTTGPQLAVSLDGIFQEPGVDYVASGNVLTMGTAPPINSRFWGLWYTPGAPTAPPTNTPPANLALPAITGATPQGSTLTATVGGWAGYPTPTYAFQFKSNGVNVGTNASTYTTAAGDLGHIMTVVVTATNSSGSTPATSGNFGPVTAPVVTDTTPDAFTFVDKTLALVSTYYESNTITVTGIDTPANVSITGGEYSKNGSVFNTVATTAQLNDTFKVRGISSPANSTAINVVLTIGGVSDTFTITTEAAPVADTTPDPFTFTDVVGVAVSTIAVSNSITVTGTNAAATMTIVGGEYSVNGGAWASSTRTVLPNTVVQVRGTSSPSGATTTTVTLDIGGVSDVFSITTAAASLLTPTLELVALADTGLSFTDNITNDNTPMFDVICASTPQVGDKISLYKDAILVVSVTLTQTDIDGTTMPGLGTTPLPDGSYVFFAVHSRGATSSGASLNVSVTIDTVKPVLTAAAGIQNATVSGNADLSITTDTAAGVVYWVVQPSTMAAPTPTQIINHSNSNDLWVDPGMSGNFTVTSSGAKTATASGFSGTGNFKVHWTHTDVAGNNALTVSSAQWTQTIASFAAHGIGGFDGSTAYATGTITPATSIAAGKKGLISFWAKNLGGSGTRYIFTIATGGTIKFWVYVNTSNAIQVTARDAAAATALDMQSVGAGSPLVPPSNWVHCALAWDLSAATPVGQIYLNGVLNMSGTKTLVASDISYNQTTASVGGGVTGTLKYNGSLSELYINLHETLDLSNPINLQKFRSNAGLPVQLGPTGLLPTGTQPEFYLGDDNVASNWLINNGSKGNLAMVAGTLTDVTGPP